MRERFKRFLLLTYQFDAFFALVHKTPPILHYQEIGVNLPSTFALWNTYGLDVFAKRHLEEPAGRSDLQMCEIANRRGSFTSSSQVLVEDILLGLCGKLQAIWALSETFPSKTKESPNSSALQGTQLIEALNLWKHELDRISDLNSQESITSNAAAARYLLLAYRAEDDSISASLERIKTLAQDG